MVTRANQRGTTLCVGEQRLVVSTLACSVHDLMADKVKDFKIQQMLECSSSENPEVEVIHTVTESKGALHRYGGFALHSMVQKRQHHMTRVNVNNELKLLNTLKVRKEEWNEVPPAIQQLTGGGLDVSSPTLLPLLHKIVEKTSSSVNEQMSKEHGRRMIELAKQELDSDSELKEIFDNLVSSDFSSECKASVLRELTHKVFHARVNEYMTATEEIELERESKAVKADQSLRDTPKTFSGMASRTL